MEGKKTRCPLCKKEAAWDNNPFRPFCSERCRVVDLGRWVDEEYRVSEPLLPRPEETEEP